MDLRFTFNENEENYDASRPGYPAELFDEIFAYAGLPPKSNVLEVGIGTGQATVPFLKSGCCVTAVELGENLARFCEKKFSGFENFRVINADFMEAAFIPNHFDLIFSATAFHWIPTDAGCRKVMSLLKPGGTFALFWNHPFVGNENDPTNRASMSVYGKHRPAEKPPRAFDVSACLVKTAQLERFGFKEVIFRIFRRTRTLTAEEYIALINTYSDHIALPAFERLSFEEDMRLSLNAVGGTVNIYDTLDLYLSKA